MTDEQSSNILDNVSNMSVGEDGNIHLEVSDTLDLLELLEYISSLDKDDGKISLVVLPGLFSTCAEEIRLLRQKIKDLEEKIDDSEFEIEILSPDGQQIALIDGDLAFQTVDHALSEYIKKVIRSAVDEQLSQKELP